MPTSADLFELFFMGPGLLCFPLVIMGLISAVRSRREKRAKQRAQSVEGHVKRANDLLWAGQIADARATALEAVTLVATAKKQATADQIADAHYCLGRILAREGDDIAGLAHLRQALAANPSDPHLRSLICANQSLSLRRVGHYREALTSAEDAVRPHAGIESYPKPFMRAGAGWAYVALSLALTDTGKDGRDAANDALQIFVDLAEESEVFDDGLAHACFAHAYALYACGSSWAYDFAREAWHRFRKLHADVPILYRDRLAESERLMYAAHQRGQFA